jgi:hypothetical protein
VQAVDGVLLQILPAVIVLHQRADIFVPLHHLHLADAFAQVEGARDGHPPQIVRRQIAKPREVRVLLHYLADHSSRERLIVGERARIGVGLKEPGVRPGGVQNLSPRAVKSQVIVNRAFHIRREREYSFLFPLTLNLMMGRP